MSMWFCENCQKSFHHQGVANHRRTHRDRKEKVVFRTPTHIITYSYDKES